MAKMTMDTVRTKLEDQWGVVRSDIAKLGDRTRAMVEKARKHDGHFRAIQKREKELTAQMSRWRRSGSKAGRDLGRGLERSMRSLRTAVKKAAGRF